MKFIFLPNPNTEDFTPIKLNVGPVQGTSHESLYKELGLEQHKKILFFYEILKVSTPKYVFDIIPVSNGNCYNTRAQSKSELT